MKLKRLLLPLLLLLAFNTYANPEIGRQVHFVLDKNDANHELKVDAGNCDGGVIPHGDGTASGQIICKGTYRMLPWSKVEGLAATMEYVINSNETANIVCKLFDYSNNAGNNQGYNVTQYNATSWKHIFKAESGKHGYKVTATTMCFLGLQQ